MDWIEEKIGSIRAKLNNVSLKKALLAYVLVFAVLAVVMTWITKLMCGRWTNLLYQQYEVFSYDLVVFYNAAEHMSQEDAFTLTVLWLVNDYCVVVYSVISMFLASAAVYKVKLKKPLIILENGTKEIKKSNLDFSLSYDSTDELGMLCKSFEEMRIGLLQEKEKMWELLEEKKRVNTAFAHDLRTPLTVLRGYADVLIRYVPEGKIGQEKLIHTLQTMSGQIIRLESFSNTMKNIHRLEDIPLELTTTKLLTVCDKIEGICEMLNMAGGVNLRFEKEVDEQSTGELDMQIVLEVFENLLSNAIRYAKQTVTITLSQKEHSLLMYVLDDGQGFDEEELKKATNAYYGKEKQEDSAHFGIGLYVSSILCERHGGRLDIANSINGGALVSAEFAASGNLQLL